MGVRTGGHTEVARPGGPLVLREGDPQGDLLGVLVEH